MKTGSVKFFDTQKGYGFIKPSDQGQDIFVHQSSLVDEVKKEDEVEYEEERTAKGLSAINVRLLS